MQNNIAHKTKLNIQNIFLFLSAAKRVLEWAKHTLDNNPLTLKRLESPKKAPPTITEPPLSEEKRRTIKVTGIAAKTTKDALLNFFENKRRSGGGEVEEIQYNEDEGLAEVTFYSPEGLFVCLFFIFKCITYCPY